MTDHPNRPDRKFEASIAINASIAEVWNALTDPVELARWFGSEAAVMPGVGGTIEWKWGDAFTWTNRVEEWRPGQYVRLCCDSDVPDGRGGKKPLIIEFILEGRSGVTTLRLVHSGFGPEADFDFEYDGISGGWPTELRSLRHYLENHKGRNRVLAWEVMTIDETPDRIWERLVDSDGLNAANITSLKEGDRFEISVPGTDGLRGRALHSPSQHEFTGVADNVGGAWFRVHCGNCGGGEGGTQVWLWLALYDNLEQAPKYRKAFRALLDRVRDLITAASTSAA